jgi:hypothetical protein
MKLTHVVETVTLPPPLIKPGKFLLRRSSRGFQIVPQVPFRLPSSQLQELAVPDNIREQELGNPRLAGPEKLTRSPNFKIFFRNLESILGLAQDVDSLLSLLGAKIFGH